MFFRQQVLGVRFRNHRNIVIQTDLLPKAFGYYDSIPMIFTTQKHQKSCRLSDRIFWFSHEPDYQGLTPVSATLSSLKNCPVGPSAANVAAFTNREAASSTVPGPL